MIAEGQVLDVLIQPFAQVQRHIFARLTLPATFEKVDRAAHNIQPHQRQTNDPQVARHKARAAPAIHPAVDKRRHGGGLAAEIIVQRFGQQQGGQVIDDHADQHAQRRPDKEPFILRHQLAHQAHPSLVHRINHLSFRIEKNIEK